ncbi:MAG TPA: di-trans,poly-cis-decaprenylcistransferase, partial [Candidatus Mediterraneibacter caccogallinarum]|nr:di-trans,poly-cis-decaprenylcistransferase [Candidatus Mediterraneibacter caccogallinarum]
MKVPQHIAIILDGNGRWAKSKGMPRNYGHAQGSKNVERICEEAWRVGIKYLTVYAFSTENWNRPDSEVSALMTLLRNYMKTCLKTAAKNDMKIRVIGDIQPLDDDIKNRISELESATVNNGGLNFTIALNYGSRDELTRAARKMARDCADGKLEADDIDESV